MSKNFYPPGDKKEKENLEKLREEILRCQRCRLYKTARQAVPGEGDPNAKIFLIGEAPGFWEDQKGRPFVGEAGQILEELLSSVGLKREEVFTANVIKHRPPQNRDPQEEEIQACRPWLWDQIRIIDPPLIIALGRFALEAFFPGEKISRVHGQKKLYSFNRKRKIVIPMFHPAAVLWNRRTQVLLEEDFLKIRPIIKEII